MLLLGFIALLVMLFVALTFGAITAIAVAFKYLLYALFIWFLLVGVYTWIKIGYKKTKVYIYNKVHYPKGTYNG